AAGRDVQSTRRAEIRIAADAQDTAIDVGRAEIGVGASENQSAETGLGQAGLRADIGEITADDAGTGERGPRARVDRAVLDQLHVVGDSEVPVPTSQGAGVEKNVARKHAGAAQGQGALADGD